MEEPSLQTYEQASALKLQSKAADPIHYNIKYSYRNSKYRHLYHQNGIIGHFKVRLVEAKNLKRWHWSVLGMGPVKLLGLSHAHGQVSSFAVMKLVFRSRRKGFGDGVTTAEGLDMAATTTVPNSNVNNTFYNDSNNVSCWENDSIASAVSASTSASASAPSPLSFSYSSSVKKQFGRQQQSHGSCSVVNSTVHAKEYKSSVVRSNSNPSWPTVQSSSNFSIFNIALEKGIMPKDGMEIYLSIQMKEEWSAVDSFVPVKSGGDGMLGEAEINLTPLVLRGFNVDDALSVPFHDVEKVDFLDEWVALKPPSSRSSTVERSIDAENEEFESAAGKVRMIVSYEPHGFSPRRGDIVALEAFARQSVAMSTYRPIIHPSHPLRVRDVRGEYLLCSFDLPCCKDGNLYNSDGRRSQKSKEIPKEGSIRLHRNAVFVIERTNLVDSAINVALKPADVVLSTPIGKEVTSTISPYVEAAGECRE